MNWPLWIDEYPGLQKRMEVVVERMKAAYAEEGQDPPKKNSEIAKEAQYLQRKLKELEDRYYRLEIDSMRANLPENVREWMPAFDYQLLDSCNDIFMQRQSRLIRIEEAHKQRDSRDKSASIDEQFILYIVRVAFGRGLEINRNNAERYTALVDSCYINAEVDCPDKVDYLLSKVKRETKKNLYVGYHVIISQKGAILYSEPAIF